MIDDSPLDLCTPQLTTSDRANTNNYQSSKRRRHTLGLLCSSLLLLFGCSTSAGDEEKESDEDKEAANAQACSETLDYLEDTAWPEVLSKVCTNCHALGGVAPANGSDLVLLPPGYPNFQQRNLEHLAKVGSYEVDSTSILLLKPTGKLDHGGGKMLEKDSKEYSVLEELVSRIQDSNECKSETVVPDFPQITHLTAHSTLRKATLHLAYRLPTSEENKKLNEDGDEALAGLIDKLFEEEAFYERLKDIFNERFLTERYLAYTGYSVNLLSDTMYPETGEPWDLIEDDERRRAISHALADEPLDFVAYLVKNNKKFTDIVAGNYMVVNPLTAPYLNAEVEFDDPNDFGEFKETTRRGYVEVERDVYKKRTIPNAGVLTSPIFLNRFPTTETNRNRHRARKILEIFLATDLLKIGDRPLDPTQAGLYPNPTMNDASCAACHEIMDPIAGAFQKYSDGDQERYVPNRDWYGEMRAAGFNGAQMSTSDIPKAPLWLGKRIAKDPRFPFAMVKIVYQGLMGRSPVEYPQDFNADDYDDRFEAWRSQEALFQAIGQKFVDSEYNLRVVFREILLSPFYRAIGVDSEPESWKDQSIAQLGTGRLSTPMLLARKIEAVTGISWTRSWDRTDYLLSDYRILYGGIDSDTITKRLETPNGVMAGVAWRMANEMACVATSWDFYLENNKRKLFPHVNPQDAPETIEGEADEQAVEKIKKNIVHLHDRILGTSLEEDDPEVERTYKLFLDTWREGRELIEEEDNGIGTRLPYNCQVRVNRLTGADLDENDRFEDDELYTVRAWMAVNTYLLSDYHFLYE